MNKAQSTFLGLACLMLVFFSCNKDGDNENSNEAPAVPAQKASLDITLAASYNSRDIASYNQVNIDIQQVSYHTSGDSTVGSGWFDLETTPGIYNLMDYVEDDTLIAFDSLVSAQMISQVRLILGDSNTVMVDSILYDLSTPSGQTSGIKLQVHTELLPDSTYVIMLDFDPEESVKQTGNGQYKLKPVIRTIVNP
jgi:hypothetical protein